MYIVGSEIAFTLVALGIKVIQIPSFSLLICITKRTHALWNRLVGDDNMEHFGPLESKNIKIQMKLDIHQINQIKFPIHCLLSNEDVPTFGNSVTTTQFSIQPLCSFYCKIMLPKFDNWKPAHNCLYEFAFAVQSSLGTNTKIPNLEHYEHNKSEHRTFWTSHFGPKSYFEYVKHHKKLNSLRTSNCLFQD